MIEKIREIKSLLGDDYQLLVNAFAIDNRKNLDNAKKYFQLNDALKMANEVHSVKGAAANLGAEQLSALCQQLESQGRKNNLEGAGPLFDSIYEKFDEVVETLRQELDH